jgi:hypothetical protein
VDRVEVPVVMVMGMKVIVVVEIISGRVGGSR